MQDGELRNSAYAMATRDGHLPSKPQLLSPAFTIMVCCPKFKFKAFSLPPPRSPYAFLRRHGLTRRRFCEKPIAAKLGQWHEKKSVGFKKMLRDF